MQRGGWLSGCVVRNALIASLVLTCMSLNSATNVGRQGSHRLSMGYRHR